MKNFSDPNISLTAIGEHFKVSTKYITMLFKQTTGITYLQYVQERRIALAVHELRHTDASFEEIARRSGYSNMLTFRRNFKSIMGMNPIVFLQVSKKERDPGASFFDSVLFDFVRYNDGRSRN